MMCLISYVKLLLGNLSTIIGASVGAVAGLAILIIAIIIVYVLVVKRRRTYQEMKNK